MLGAILMLGMLKKYTVELSPEVRGQLLNQKKPLSHHKVARSLIYGDEEYLDETITDMEGNFQLSKKSIKSKLPGNVFHEPKVQVYITTEVHGAAHLLWFSNQDGININPLYINYLNSLNADISNKEESFWIDEPQDPNLSYQIHSICRW